MLLTKVEVYELERALKTAVFLAQQHGINEVLKYINISVENDCVIVRANSPDSYLSNKIDVVYSGDRVSFNIHFEVANALLESIKSYSEVDLSLKPDKKSGKMNYLVATHEGKKTSFIIINEVDLLTLDFYEIEVEEKIPAEFVASGLKTGLTSTVKSGDPRHGLYSVAMKLNDVSSIYSTNSQIIGITEEAIGLTRDMGILILSVPNAKNMLKFIESSVMVESMLVGVSDDSTKVIFVTTDNKCKIVLNLLQGEHINISSFISTKKQIKLVNNNLLQYRLQSAKLFVLKDFPFVELTIKEGKLDIVVDKSKIGKFKDTIELKDDSMYIDDVTFYLDINMLATVLKNIPDTDLYIGFDDQSDGSIMLSGERYSAYLAKIDEKFLPSTIN